MSTVSSDPVAQIDTLSSDVRHIESAAFGIVDKLWPRNAAGGGRSMLVGKNVTNSEREQKKNYLALLTTQKSFDLKVLPLSMSREKHPH